MGRYRNYSDALKARYGEKVYKVPLSLPVTCPNRDGTLGEGGCIFCGSIGADYETAAAGLSITAQLERSIAHIGPKYRAKQFIAYFPNFTGAYAGPRRISGRGWKRRRAIPRWSSWTCPPGRTASTRSIWISCGISRRGTAWASPSSWGSRRPIPARSACSGGATPRRNSSTRRSALGAMASASARTSSRTFPGTTGRTRRRRPGSCRLLPVTQVKFHSLYIVKGTKLAAMAEAGEVRLLPMEEYVERVLLMLSLLRADIAVQRIVGRASGPRVLAVNGGEPWWDVKKRIEQELILRDLFQGCRCDYMDGKAVRRWTAAPGTAGKA